MAVSRATIRANFEARAPVFTALRGHLDGVLAPFSTGNGWLYSSRIKDVESYLQKLETGWHATSVLDDALACTIVVQTLRDIELCVSSLPPRVAIDAGLSKRTAATMKDPEIFRFDDERLICRLAAPSALDSIDGTIWATTFELQIKTITQFAWGAITHPLVYKGDMYDWRRARLSAQLRAMAEQVDLIYAEFETYALRIGRRTSKRSGRLDRVSEQYAGWVKDGLVPPGREPPSFVRFAESVLEMTERLGLDTVKVCRATTVELDTNGLGESISLLQLVLGVAITSFGGAIDWTKSRKYRAFVTSEMEDRFPAVKAVPDVVRVTM